MRRRAALDAALTAEIDALLAAQAAGGWDLIVVTNEVGLGIVPATPLGRVFRDALGRANQALAAAPTRSTCSSPGSRCVSSRGRAREPHGGPAAPAATDGPGGREPSNLFRAEMALLQCGRWTVTFHRDGDRDDPPASEERWAGL